MEIKVNYMEEKLQHAFELFHREKFDELITEASEILGISQDCYSAWVLRGAGLLRTGNFYGAILSFDRAIQLRGDLYDAWNNRGMCYFRLTMIDEAIADFHKAISLNPDVYAPHFQLGLLYTSIERPELAEFHLRKGFLLCPEGDSGKVASAIFLGTHLQGIGQWKEGLTLDKYRNKLKNLRTNSPFWQGEDLTGKNLFAYIEGGWGDKIMSLRYLNLLKEKYDGLRIMLGVQPDLRELVSHSFPDIEIYTGYEEGKSDYTVSLTDVPLILDLAWNTVPRPEKYLAAPPKYVAKWKEKVDTLPKKLLNVGFCWASKNGISKVIQPWDMLEFGGVQEVNFVSLQKPYVQSGFQLTDWTNDIHDWADTAGLIDNLDLIVTIDTGVAHLAGAMGKPVWTIVKHSTYWPWMDAKLLPSKDYSIWYPSMMLFRQERMNDWLHPVRRVILLLLARLEALTQRTK